MKINIIDKEDLKGLKYYLTFTVIILGIYLYSMITGWRFMSFNESSHTKDAKGIRTRTYFHK